MHLFFFWYKQSKNNIFKYDVLKPHGGNQQKESSINYAIAGKEAGIQNP